VHRSAQAELAAGAETIALSAAECKAVLIAIEAAEFWSN
jgi:hypothetical protein